MFDTSGFEGVPIDSWVMESNAFMKSIVAAHILIPHSWQSSCMSLDGQAFGKGF